MSLNQLQENKAFVINLWLSIFISFALSIIFVMYVFAEKEIDRAYSLQHDSFLLAEELRLSSEDLTRMARTYVVNGDPIYKKYYIDILDIREGKKTRSEEYISPDWNSRSASSEIAKQNPGKLISFLDLLREKGFTAEEIKKLQDAKQKSDALTSIEYEAMNLIEPTGFNKEANRNKAINLLHNNKYMTAKVEIMQPISDFMQMMNERTLKIINKNKNTALTLRVIFIIVGLGLFFTLWRTYLSLNKILGSSLNNVYEQIEKIGNGDFYYNALTKNIQVSENSIMKWLLEMQNKLQDADITRKLSQDLLESSEKFLITLADSLPGMVGYWTKNLYCSFANRHYLEWFGKTKEQMQGIHIKELLGDSLYSANLPYIQKALSGEKVNFERVIKKPDGKLGYVWAQYVPDIDTITGSVAGFFVLVSDITEIKEMEKEVLEHQKRLEYILNNQINGVVQVNPEGQILYANNAAANILGIEQDQFSTRYFNARVWRQIDVNGDPLPIEKLPLTLAMSEKRAIENIKHGIISDDNEVKWLLVNALPLLDSENKLTGAIANFIDITNQHNYEESLKKAKEQAEFANKSKSEFLTNMSHEIRTPLNAVIGFTDLLMKTKLNESQLQYMGIVYQSANSLLDLLNDILDFSKIEAGKLELIIEKIDLFEMAGQAADIIKYKAHNKDIEILLNMSPTMPRYIFADRIRLRQVIINLLGNSVKFTESGEIEIKIEVIETECSEGDTVFLFSVRDTGIGISKENEKKIYEAFSQADSSISRKFGGTGLGLTISNKLLALMNSKLELKTEEGRGSEFFFKLKVKSEQGEPSRWEDLNKIKSVLAVDNNEHNLFILQKILLQIGIQVDISLNGRDALNKIEKNKKYDLIIMDYHMPQMDGIETIRQIRSKKNLISELQPIILLHSSSDDTMIEEACKELNILAKILKPIKPDELLNTLLKIQKSIPGEKINYKEEESLHFNISPNPAHGKESSNTRILVVDDDEINLYLARSILNQLIPGAVIIEANNGKQAIEEFKNNKPDIIFLDIQMPNMNGYDVCKEIRKLEGEPKVRIIALTAGTVKGDVDKCFQVGMDDYASKPVKKDLFQKIIEKWL